MELLRREAIIENIDEIAKFIKQYGGYYQSLMKNLIYNYTNIRDISSNFDIEQLRNEVRNMDLIHRMLYIFAHINLPSKNIEIPCDLASILSKFNIYNSEYDPYLYMYELLKKYSFLDNNCCEIGAGFYPTLAEIIQPDIEKNQHNLVIYESCIVSTEFKGIKVVKEKFNKKADFSNIDTIIGKFPCEATVDIAEKAFEEDKNLLLACCGCDHSTPKHRKWFGEYWSEDFCADYKEKYGDEVIIESWPSRYGIPFPIMIRQSSKQKIKDMNTQK